MLTILGRHLTLLLLVAGLSFGQLAPRPVKPTAPKSDGPVDSAATSRGSGFDDVIAMVKGGISEDLIITSLRKDNKTYDLSPMQMLDLKKAGVSDNIIKAMIDPKSQTQPTGAGVTVVGFPGLPKASGATPGANVSDVATAANINNPDAPHDSGIYLYTDVDGERRMVALERAGYQGNKTGGIFTSAMTYGIKKAKVKAVVPGARASIRTGDARPVFYFYFEDKSAGLGKSNNFGGQTVSNPNQFALIELEQKGSNRETAIAKVGAFGASSGTDEKQMRSVKSERIRSGVYRVVPVAGLEPGEYCFLASGAGGAGAAAAVDIFDFGVNSNR